MANKRKYSKPTIQKNLRIPVTIDNWLRKKSRSTGDPQVDLLLEALASKWPEVKGLLS